MTAMSTIETCRLLRRSPHSRDEAQQAALATLAAHGETPPELRSLTVEGAQDLLATRLMDLFRRTGSPEVFDQLAHLTHDQLLQRVRLRSRFLSQRVDPEELVQDALINIYRYPDRFDARRSGAFRAWSSMIVDNALRRHLRQRMQQLRLQPTDLLEQEPDLGSEEPICDAIRHESEAAQGRAVAILLVQYLAAYQTLSERERFVLWMVEVQGKRYAELAGGLAIRPEALKMVVFRARKRIAERMEATAKLLSA